MANFFSNFVTALPIFLSLLALLSLVGLSSGLIRSPWDARAFCVGGTCTGGLVAYSILFLCEEFSTKSLQTIERWVATLGILGPLWHLILFVLLPFGLILGGMALGGVVTHLIVRSRTGRSEETNS
jgi:hypothetical protein